MSEESQPDAGTVRLTDLRENPGDAGAAAFVSAVSDPGVPTAGLESAFREALRDGALDPGETTATLLDTLAGDRYEKHPGVARLLGVVAEEETRALAPFADRVVALVAESDVAADELAACLPPLAGTDPEAVLTHADEVATLLDSELPTARHAAVGTFVVLAESRPERLAGFVPDLVAVLNRDQPDLAGSIDGVAENRPRTPDTMRRQLTETRHRVSAIREGAALALHDLATADADAVVGHVDELADALDAAIADRVRALVLAALVSVARERPAAGLAARRSAAQELSRDAGSEAQGEATRLLSVLADTHGEAVADSLRGSDAIPALADVLDGAGDGVDGAGDETGHGTRVAAASLFVALSRHAPGACTDASEELEAVAGSGDDEVSALAETAVDRLGRQ